MDCAYREITFALTILESLCEDNMLDEKMTSRAKDLARRLRPDMTLSSQKSCTKERTTRH